MATPEENEKLFSYREYFGAGIFREPRKGVEGKLGWTFAVGGVLVGLAWILMGIFSIFGGFLEVVVGIGFILMFSGDLLPKDRTRLAGYFRIGAFAVCFVVFLFLFMTWMA